MNYSQPRFYLGRAFRVLQRGFLRLEEDVLSKVLEDVGREKGVLGLSPCVGHAEREPALVQDASFLLQVLLGTAGQQQMPLDLGAPMGMLEFSRCTGAAGHQVWCKAQLQAQHRASSYRKEEHLGGSASP